MSEDKKKPGPKPELFKVSLAFEDALCAAVQTPAPKKPATAKKQTGSDPSE